ncbi:conserved hypothetical protein [Sporisorium reilianum SRZ2]|uniref:C2H2-type domain-containing protein n=1 Tax=Sporisorium reilianum (strain SRZ2) TaxID=999809 RepID=E6ZYN3_SPORE|nr:conserved hypothetical protein [Sporisorium reilianum SRZ2]
MLSSDQTSYFFIDPHSQPRSPLTPGSDTSTLFEFVVDDPSASPLDSTKAADLVSPTETLADRSTPLERFDESARSSRRFHYLERIEKVLSTELNPFDLLARTESDSASVRTARCQSFVAGTRLVDAVPDSGVDMQNPTSGAPTNANPFSHAGLQPIDDKNGAFYDPSSADGYSAPSQSSFLNAPSPFATPASSHLSPSASPAPGAQLGAPNAFRDYSVHPSPQSSPHLGSISPAASHHRTGSHSSDVQSPPRFGQSFTSDLALNQTLGQIGQIKLDEDQRYPPVFDDASDFGGSPAFPQSSAAKSTSSFAPSAYASIPSSSSAQQANARAPQLTLGIPTVSVSDTSMDFTPIAATVASQSDANMPSINVMAPSPSTPRASGPHAQGGGFQDVLAQLLQRAQSISDGLDGSSNHMANSGSWLPSAESTALHNEPFSYADTSATTVGSQLDSNLSQASAAQDLFRPHSASGRLVPEGYSAETGQMMSTLAGGPQRNTSVHAPGQWSSQAKRQDSYDKIRQFLRLDVDMGFQNAGKTESPTLASFRKRANSDVGPRSPIVAGNVEGAGFDWSFAATSQAAAKSQTNGLDFDWSSFKADPALFAGSISQMDPSQLATMDPSLLNNVQLPLDLSQGFGQNDALLASMQQQQQQQPMMAPVFQLNDQSNTLGGIDFSSQLGNAGATEYNPQWRFPGDASQGASASGTGTAGATRMRRSNSARHSASGGHRRLAHSEDLSRSRMYQGADEDFLAQITAPNGGLAPPQTGRSVSSSNSATGSHHHAISGSARVHPYRTGHDRHYSFGSNTSSSSTGSASPLPQMAGGFVYDAAGNLVQYPTDVYGAAGVMGGAMDANAANSPSASSVASGTSSQLAPPVPVVTSQATQAASASRRKSEALFACPIPGCGSTFTRQYNLRGHLRSHADERPYKCDWPGCDKSFARSHDCKRHQNLHLNIKPHTCEQCGKTFARLDALNRHHKSDTGGCNSESQSNSTDASSGGGGASDHGDANRSQDTAEASAGNTSFNNKGFGGHVL